MFNILNIYKIGYINLIRYYDCIINKLIECNWIVIWSNIKYGRWLQKIDLKFRIQISSNDLRSWIEW